MMKETGIVRRIDELGRVVIPKEIRRTMRIKEGDPLEIFAQSDMLYLKKFSPISKIGDFAEAVAESLNAVTDSLVFVCDADKILSAKGRGAKDHIGKEVSAAVQKSASSRQTEVYGDGNSAELTADGLTVKNAAIVPIISEGDVIGFVIIADDDTPIDVIKIRLAMLAAEFIARQY